MKFNKMSAVALSALMAFGTIASVNVAYADEDVTLKVALWDYSNVDYYKNIFAAFEEANPGFKVEALEFAADEYANVVTTQLGGQSDFDIVFNKDIPMLAALSQQGHLYALDELIAGDDSFDVSVYNGMVEQTQLNGTTYSLPFRSDNTLLYYNKDLFDAAGVDYPTDGMTLAEYHELATKMTSGFGNDKVYGAHNHTWTTNVTNFARRLGNYNPNDPTTYDDIKAAYAEILAMQEEGCIQDYGMLKSSNIHYSGVFYNQQVAMLPIGTWYINMLTTNVSDFNWGVCAIPSVDGMGNENSVGGVTTASIGAYSKNPEAAWTLLKYVCGEDGGKVLAENGIVPGMITDGVKEIFDAIPQTYPNAPEGLSKYIVGEVSAVVETPMDPKAKEIGSILDEMHSAIMTLSVSVDDGIANAISRIGEIE